MVTEGNRATICQCSTKNYTLQISISQPSNGRAWCDFTFSYFKCKDVRFYCAKSQNTFANDNSHRIQDGNHSQLAENDNFRYAYYVICWHQQWLHCSRLFVQMPTCRSPPSYWRVTWSESFPYHSPGRQPEPEHRVGGWQIARQRQRPGRTKFSTLIREQQHTVHPCQHRERRSPTAGTSPRLFPSSVLSPWRYL